MKNWSEIPIEILNIITTYCGRDCTQVKWMFTNKRWFTFYLSQVYKTITTSLGDEPVINKILYSAFDVGKHVKRVNLANIDRPTDLNTFDLSNNFLGSFMKRTPNVFEVSLSRTNQNLVHQDWIYFSAVLINTDSWNLQLLPSLGENNILSAASYYMCAYYSRHTLKCLELSLYIAGERSFYDVEQFKALENLEVHKNLINGLNEIGLLVQYTPKLKELTIQFATGRAYQLMEKRNTTYSSIKKLTLYNFNPQGTDELLTLVQKFPALEKLYIYGERDDIWIVKISDNLVIERFFNCINSIPEYEITMTGDEEQEYPFLKLWLQFIENSKQDVHLLETFKEEDNQYYLNFQAKTVVTFCGGSRQSTLLLKYAMMEGQLPQEVHSKLRVLNHQKVSSLKIVGVGTGLEIFLKEIIAKKRTCLKKITFFDCELDLFTPPDNPTFVSQHIKEIVFLNCEMGLLPLKLFLEEFKSLDYIEFDSCKLGDDTSIKSIDIRNTDVKSIEIVNFQKIASEQTYSTDIQTLIAISIQDLTRYFYVFDDNLIEITKRRFKILSGTFNNEAVILYIKLKSLQQLLLQLTETSKIFNITFSR